MSERDMSYQNNEQDSTAQDLKRDLALTIGSLALVGAINWLESRAAKHREVFPAQEVCEPTQLNELPLPSPEPALPVLYLSAPQRQRLAQYEQLLRTAERNQISLLKGETWVFPLRDEEGKPMYTEENKMLGIIIDQETVESMYRTAKTIAKGLEATPNTATAAKMVRDRLEREREAAIQARRERAVEETQQLTELWERSTEIF